jgi:hypothetical protein
MVPQKNFPVKEPSYTATNTDPSGTPERAVQPDNAKVAPRRITNSRKHLFMRGQLRFESRKIHP